MKRIKNLNLYQKFVLVASVVMIMAFAVAYFAVTSRVGYKFKGNILVPEKQGNTTVYSGKVYGHNIDITVTADKTVTFEYEEKTYGPYTVREDITAIPEDEIHTPRIKGVEILDKDKIFFRGGFIKLNMEDINILLYSEDGSWDNVFVSVAGSDGVVYNADGSPVDQLAPSAENIVELVYSPQMTHKGAWLGWFGGTLFAVLTALEILFADEIFRWNMQFRIRNVNKAEPSDWEIFGRYVSWTVMPLVALYIYFTGLTV